MKLKKLALVVVRNMLLLHKPRVCFALRMANYDFAKTGDVKADCGAFRRLTVILIDLLESKKGSMQRSEFQLHVFSVSTLYACIFQ